MVTTPRCRCSRRVVPGRHGSGPASVRPALRRWHAAGCPVLLAATGRWSTATGISRAGTASIGATRMADPTISLGAAVRRSRWEAPRAGATPGASCSNAPTSRRRPDSRKPTHDTRSVTLDAVTRIDAIFDVERSFGGRDAAQRIEAWERLVRLLIDALHDRGRTAQGSMSRHDPMARAIADMVKSDRWQAVIVQRRIDRPDQFVARLTLDDGRICITNIPAGRALCGIALGWTSWAFGGCDRGGARGAFLYSLIVTATLNDIVPQAWLANVLGLLTELTASQVSDLLPWNWQLPAHRHAARGGLRRMPAFSTRFCVKLRVGVVFDGVAEAKVMRAAPCCAGHIGTGLSTRIRPPGKATPEPCARCQRERERSARSGQVGRWTPCGRGLHTMHGHACDAAAAAAARAPVADGTRHDHLRSIHRWSDPQCRWAICAAGPCRRTA